MIDNRKAHQMDYDDSIVRQMIECIKAFPEGRLQVFFGGGIMIEEKLR